jgi:hypothetical protein
MEDVKMVVPLWDIVGDPFSGLITNPLYQFDSANLAVVVSSILLFKTLTMLFYGAQPMNYDRL